MNAELLQNLLVIALNVSVMLAMGLDLTLGQLRHTLRRGDRLAVGLALNLLVVPLAGAAMIHLFALPPAAALGFLLCVASAGGPTGPLLTANARGDTAYSVALVMILSFASVAAVPLLVRVLGGAVVPANGSGYVGQIITMILLWQILPLCAGMAFHHWRPAQSPPLHRLFKALGNLSLVVLTIALLILKGRLVFANGWQPLLACALMVTLVFVLCALVERPSTPYGRALMFTTSIRSLALALLLASQVFADPVVVLMTLTYGLFMFASSVPLAFAIGRRPPGGT